MLPGKIECVTPQSVRLLLYKAALTLLAPFASPTKFVEFPPESLIDALSLLDPDVEKLTIATIRILLVDDDGVIVADKPVTAVNVPLVVVNVSVFAVLTTCKIRNAPRKLFNCEARSTSPEANAAGSVVGVAIVSPILAD